MEMVEVGAMRLPERRRRRVVLPAPLAEGIRLDQLLCFGELLKKLWTRCTPNEKRATSRRKGDIYIAETG